MSKDNSNKNLQKASFKNEDLSYANFSGSDLRGADFSGANLTGANLANVRTGITPLTIVLIFVVALAISLFSGYVSAQLGKVIKAMINDPEQKIRMVGFITIGIMVLFLIYTLWKGGHDAIKNLIIPVIIVTLVLVVIVKISGLGTGSALLYQGLVLILLVIMIIIGTIARAAAGNLSNVLFTIVALSGGMFGQSLASWYGPLILATTCMFISKRALSGAKGFEGLRKVAFFITTRFGTSFRNAKLVNTDFSHSRLHNADFTGADLVYVNWGDAKRFNCKEDNIIITDKKTKKHG